jgi:beta-xylosidase
MVRRHRPAVVAIVAALVALGTLTVAVQTDVGAHARDRQEHTDLAAADTTLAASQLYLEETTYVEAVTTNHRSDLQTSVTSTLGQLTATEKTLTTTDAFAFLQGVGVGSLQTCLGGIQSAYQQIAAQHNKRAASDISAVSSACLTLAGGTSTGLVYPFDFPDPDVLDVGGSYFAYATNSVGGNIQIIESSDLTHWSAVGNALPKLPAWAAPDGTWAPSVIQLGGTFVLYYAAIAPSLEGVDECISVATATQPQGPFVDSSAAPLECQPTLDGSIDPSPFVDSSGGLFLQWKSNGGAAATTIWSEQLDPSGMAMAPNTVPVQLLVPDESWQGGMIEAPDLVETGGRYLLFYSGNYWGSSNYGVGFATCTGPLGPCTEASPQPFLASGSGVSGPGGESVFTDSSGSFWIAFAAWAPGQVGYPHSREFYLRRLSLSNASPYVGSAG